MYMRQGELEGHIRSDGMSAELKIKHVLADGRKIDSIDGFVIPETGPTAAVYRIAADFARKHQQTAPKEVKNATA